MEDTLGMDCGATAAGQKESAQALEKAKAAVKELHHFSAHFCHLHGVESAGKKWEEVKGQLKKTIALLDSLQEKIPKVSLWGLKGRALNVLPEHSQEAEDLLSRSIKHDPLQVDTWNALGESYWKAGKIQQAHDCFVGCLAHSKSKETLRNLSMVLRQIGESPAEKEENVKKSVERAREAVTLDVKDGISWMILGNAYLSVFFMSGQEPKVLRQSISAYTHAEKDPLAATNPDLHFNRSTLCQFEEDYQGMMKELEMAAALDPEWTTPREKLSTMWNLFTTLANLISTKGKVKARVLSTMMEALSSPDKYLESLEEEWRQKELVPLSRLKEGINQEGVAVVGVVSVVPFKDRVPYVCVVLDAASSCLGLTLYNLAATTNLAVGTILTVPQPVLQQASLQYKGEVVEFRNIQVTDPSRLLVNGSKLGADKLARPSLSVQAFS